MANKRPHNTGKGARSAGDNFRAINGVSSVVESCLHRAGILTYAQFASLSPDDIITIVGNVSALSLERVAKQNWIGQARELAMRTPSNESRETSEENPEGNLREASEAPAPGGEEPRREKFQIELLLGRDKTVTQTRVRHARTGYLEEWDGWLEKRLINLIARQAGIRETRALADDEQHSATAQTASDDRSATNPNSVAPRTIGAARPVTESAPPPAASKLEIWTSASNTPANLARHDQPFDVRLKLDPASLAALGGEPLVYNAVFYARGIGDHRDQASRRVSGKIERLDNPSITIQGLYLQPGSYVLNASVIFDRLSDQPFDQRGEASTKSGALRIQTENSLLHIY